MKFRFLKWVYEKFAVPFDSVQGTATVILVHRSSLSGVEGRGQYFSEDEIKKAYYFKA
jgi:hypothetical protein